MKITDKEIKYNNVKSAADLLSTEDMTAEQVKNIFDKLPELIAKKHNKLVDYVNEAVRSPESAQFDIQLFTNPAQFGSSYDAPMVDIFAAMPKNSLALLNPAKCTDDSWNLPQPNGVLEIKKNEIRGKIILWTRLGTSGDWTAVFDGSNKPTGVWVKYLNSVDGSEISELAARAKEGAEEARQLGYDGINKANAAKAAVDSLEADLGVITHKQFDSVSLANGAKTLAGQIVLAAGKYIVQFGGYFSQNANGYRMVHLSTSADPLEGEPYRRWVLSQMGVDGKVTYLSGTTFITLTKSTTVSIVALQGSGDNLNFYGYLSAMQITGETVVMVDGVLGGDVDIFG